MPRTDDRPGSLTHFDASGHAHMVDVGDKAISHRVAVAQGRVRMLRSTYDAVAAGGIGKGDVLGVARLAAIMAAKRAADLVPLCHPLPLTRVAADLSLDPSLPGVVCTVTAETHGRTGVEIEALAATQVGLLTVYDMCKAIDRGMVIESVRLLEKRGGRSGHYVAGSETPAPG